VADQGVPLDRGTMSRYMEQAGNTLGATIVHAMWADAIANGHVISTDATGALIQPTKGAKDGRAQACKKGHFFTAVVDCDAVIFAYVEHHSSESVKALFGGFLGYLQADASSVYDVLERGRPSDSDDGVTLVGCFAHLRRYFFEAAICRYPVGLHGLMRIRAIYAADEAVSRAPEAERRALREQHVRPLMTSFFDWARGARQTGQGRNLATKALGYAVNQEAELVLDDVNLPLDNTRSERALRKIVVGRKAWMFYGSDTHAEAAAAIFSVIGFVPPPPPRPVRVPGGGSARPAALAAAPIPRAVAEALARNARPLETRGAGGSSFRVRDSGRNGDVVRRRPRRRGVALACPSTRRAGAPCAVRAALTKHRSPSPDPFGAVADDDHDGVRTQPLELLQLGPKQLENAIAFPRQLTKKRCRTECRPGEEIRKVAIRSEGLPTLFPPTPIPTLMRLRPRISAPNSPNRSAKSTASARRWHASYGCHSRGGRTRKSPRTSVSMSAPWGLTGSASTKGPADATRTASAAT